MTSAFFVARDRLATRYQFVLVLLILLALLPSLDNPAHNGDANEYILTTVALSRHGTPDLRLADLDEALHMAPELATPYALVEPGIRDAQKPLYPAYYRGLRGEVYSVHFFAYPLLAVLPYKLLGAIGCNPLRCFQIANLALIFVLGLSLHRLFKAPGKAAFGVAMFMLCGGALYWDWSSPECVSAASLLAGLTYFATKAPIRGGLLAGLATMQNPTIVFFFAFAPVLYACLHYQSSLGWRENIRSALPPRNIAGIASGLALFALAPLFNLWAFGVPNIIAKTFTDTTLIGFVRLHSFYWDLNQGMIVAVPGLFAALLLALWRAPARGKTSIFLLLCALFSLALALPALSILNWNSGANGVMRYAFWDAMPFLFAFFWQLHRLNRWPNLWLGILFLAQAGCMLNAANYNYTEFSPQQKWLFVHAPGLINPEPEIFAERSEHRDDYRDTTRIYSFDDRGRAIKSLYNVSNMSAEQQLCGKGARLGAGNAFVSSYFGWRYINGPVECESAELGDLLLATAGLQHGTLRLLHGWSKPEYGGGAWTGVWSDGKASRLRIQLDSAGHPATMTIVGHYFAGIERTRVLINGVDLGWQTLGAQRALSLAGVPNAAGNTLEIELQHEVSVHAVDANAKDNRSLAFFLQKIIL